MLRICREAGIACFEKNFSLMQVYSAEEAFTTGTFAGLIAPVRSVDGRAIGDGILPGPVTARLQALYRELAKLDVAQRRPTPGMTVRAMWSGPRNISTAMMRLENRGDCAVSDEPLYAASPRRDRPRPSWPRRSDRRRRNRLASRRRCPVRPAPGDAPVWYQNT